MLSQSIDLFPQSRAQIGRAARFVFQQLHGIAIGNGVARSRQQIGQGDWFPQRAWQ